MHRYSNSLVWLLVFCVIQVLSYPQPPDHSSDQKESPRQAATSQDGQHSDRQIENATEIEDLSEFDRLNPCTLKGFLINCLQWGYDLPVYDFQSPMPYNPDYRPDSNESPFEELKRLALTFLYNLRYYENKKHVDFDTAYDEAFRHDHRLSERLVTLVKKLYCK